MARQKARTRRSFGRLRKLPSGRYQASYSGPDGRVYGAPSTFAAKIDAEAWLTDRRREIDRELWSPPRPESTVAKSTTFADYSAEWLAHRLVNGRPLKARTREHYEALLSHRLLPTFGHLPVGAVTAEDVKRWHADEGTATPSYTAQAYSLLSTIMATAVRDSLIPTNPCIITGAGYSKRVKKIRPASLEQLAAIVEAMPERFKVMVLLAAWCALRFGELTALTRGDVVLVRDPDGVLIAGELDVSKGAVRVSGERKQDTTKSEAGERAVSIPPHLLPTIEAHLAEHVDSGAGALLFPADHGGYLAPSTFYRHYYPARSAAGRDDLRFHDLRHTGAVLAASTGATLAELMNRLGHSTPTAALRYQHVIDGRDREIAAMLSRLIES